MCSTGPTGKLSVGLVSTCQRPGTAVSVQPCRSSAQAMAHVHLSPYLHVQTFCIFKMPDLAWLQLLQSTPVIFRSRAIGI